MRYKSKQSKACDISLKVKNAVWKRDNHKCILCSSFYASPNAHYIPRSKGGLGIEENVVTLCLECHIKFDQTTERQKILKLIKNYLELKYPNFKDKDRIFKK